MKLKNNEMEEIIGGSISSTFINAIRKVITTTYQLGRSTGSAIRRIVSGKYCPVN